MGNSDSKAEFRGLVEAISDENMALHPDAWSHLWKLPTSSADVNELMQPTDVRLLIKRDSANLACALVKKVRLFHFIRIF